MDYHKKKTGNTYPDAAKDPGCMSVSEIYGYYKKHGYGTIVMGASFRSKEEVLQLAGCDRLTIAPKFLDVSVLWRRGLRASRASVCAKCPITVLFRCIPFQHHERDVS